MFMERLADDVPNKCVEVAVKTNGLPKFRKAALLTKVLQSNHQRWIWSDVVNYKPQGIYPCREIARPGGVVIFHY